MTWFKVDDGFYDHPKFLDLSNAAIGLWVKAGAWCSRHRTAGRIPARVAHRLGTAQQASALVDAGLWSTADDGYKFIHWRKTQDGDYRPNIRTSVRAAVFERDGYRCVWCGSTEDLSLDHIIRYRDDGPDTVDNLRVLCMPCNWKREGGEGHA